MKIIGRDMSGMRQEHRREGYIGPISSTGDGGKSTNVNNLHNSQLRGLMNMTPYGISSRGKAGMKAQVMVNDNNNNAVVGVYDVNKPNVNPGEILLYSDGGCKIYLDAKGKITLSTGATSILVDSGVVTINGDVNINGTLKVNGVIVE